MSSTSVYFTVEPSENFTVYSRVPFSSQKISSNRFRSSASTKNAMSAARVLDASFSMQGNCAEIRNAAQVILHFPFVAGRPPTKDTKEYASNFKFPISGWRVLLSRADFIN